MSGVTTMRPITSSRTRAGLALGMSTAVARRGAAGDAGLRAGGRGDRGHQHQSASCAPRTRRWPSTRPSTCTTRAGYINLRRRHDRLHVGLLGGQQALPAPRAQSLCVNEGDTVTVILHNTFTATSPKKGPAVSIVFPGQENVLADGAPSQPQFDGWGNLTSLAKPAQRGGDRHLQLRRLRARHLPVRERRRPARRAAGSTCSPYSSPQVQVRMGLFGALIVRPARPPGLGLQPGRLARSTRRTEFMLLLSEIDPYLNAQGPPGHVAFNMNNYQPRYWLINGRQFPDSIADNFASWLPDPAVRVAGDHPPVRRGATRCPAVDRYLSVGTVDYPFHPHGNNGKVIGRDGTPLADGRRRGHVVRQVRRQRRPRPDLGRAVRLEGRRGLLARQQGPRSRTRTSRT